MYRKREKNPTTQRTLRKAAKIAEYAVGAFAVLLPGRETQQECDNDTERDRAQQEDRREARHAYDAERHKGERDDNPSKT